MTRPTYPVITFTWPETKSHYCPGFMNEPGEWVYKSSSQIRKEVEGQVRQLVTQNNNMRDRIAELEKAVGALLTCFDDGVGEDWSDATLMFARSLECHVPVEL